LYGHLEGIKVPKVIEELTTKRVLTLEVSSGEWWWWWVEAAELVVKELSVICP